MAKQYDTAPDECARTLAHVIAHLDVAQDEIERVRREGYDRAAGMVEALDQAGHDVNMALALLNEMRGAELIPQPMERTT